LLLAVTFTALILVAVHGVRERRLGRGDKSSRGKQPQSPEVALSGSSGTALMDCRPFVGATSDAPSAEPLRQAALCTAEDLSPPH
jgi:hypothetical protein